MIDQLLEKYIPEEVSLSSLSVTAPDAIPTDLDDPVGSTIIGGRMKSYYQDNRISGPIKNHKYAEDDGDSWNWNDFRFAEPMGNEDSYSNTLYGLDKLLGDRLWKNTNRKPGELHPDKKEMYRDSEVNQEEEPKPDPTEKDKAIPDQPDKEETKEVADQPNVDTHGALKDMDINEVMNRYLTEKKNFRMSIDVMSAQERRYVQSVLKKHNKDLDYSVLGGEIVVDSRDKNLLNTIADTLNGNKKFRFDVEKV